VSRPTGWVGLNQPLYEGMPRASECSAVRIEPEDLVGTGPPEAAVRTTHLTLSAHVGRNVDAALHFMPDGRSIDQYPVEAFTGPGVVIDAPREGVVPVTRDEVEALDPDVHEGDIVLFHLGYGHRFGTPGYADHPYLGEDTAHWLVERGVRMIGVDTSTPDLGGVHRPPGYPFPVHMILPSRDILIIEHLGAGLAQLAGQRVEVVAVPVPVRGADGAPAAVLARAVPGTTEGEDL
jgi:kynurenine formamidase